MIKTNVIIMTCWNTRPHCGKKEIMNQINLSASQFHVSAVATLLPCCPSSAYIRFLHFLCCFNHLFLLTVNFV